MEPPRLLFFFKRNAIKLFIFINNMTKTNVIKKIIINKGSSCPLIHAVSGFTAI